MTRQTEDVGSGGSVAWVSISEIARRKGLHRDSVRERVDRLVEKGLLQTRKEGRSRLVDLAAYDRAIGEAGDAYKEAAAETKREAPAAHKPLRDAQTERAQYEARLKALDLAERQGSVLPVKGDHGIEAALVRCGEVITREIDRFIDAAEDIAIATAKDGVSGARRVLKEEIRKRRSRIADALAEVISKGREAERTGPIQTAIIADPHD